MRVTAICNDKFYILGYYHSHPAEDCHPSEEDLDFMKSYMGVRGKETGCYLV